MSAPPLVTRGSFAPRPFSPAGWAPNAHAQTLAARMLRSADGPPLTRERLATPDDDFLDLDWGPDPGPGAPIVLVVHGLEGSARRGYMRSVCRELLRDGVWPVALNLRGCSGDEDGECCGNARDRAEGHHWPPEVVVVAAAVAGTAVALPPSPCRRTPSTQVARWADDRSSGSPLKTRKSAAHAWRSEPTVAC